MFETLSPYLLGGRGGRKLGRLVLSIATFTLLYPFNNGPTSYNVMFSFSSFVVSLSMSFSVSLNEEAIYFHQYLFNTIVIRDMYKLTHGAT